MKQQRKYQHHGRAAQVRDRREQKRIRFSRSVAANEIAHSPREGGGERRGGRHELVGDEHAGFSEFNEISMRRFRVGFVARGGGRDAGTTLRWIVRSFRHESHGPQLPTSSLL